MNSRSSIPVRFEKEPMRHSGSARYYAGRAHESLTSRAYKIVCTIILGILLVLGIIMFILWLSLRPHRPRFHILYFSVSGSDQSDGYENAALTMNVTTHNPNHRIGFQYDSLRGSVYYNGQQITSAPLLGPFYQEPQNTTVVGTVLTRADLTISSQQWTKFMNDRARGTVDFRLEITSTILFKLSMWDSKHHQLHAICRVSVGQDGSILANSINKRCPVYFT